MSFLLVEVINVAFMVYTWLIIGRIVLSWISHSPDHPLIRFVYELTDPYLALFRRIIPPIGMLDLSPIIAIIVLQILRALLISLFMPLL